MLPYLTCLFLGNLLSWIPRLQDPTHVINQPESLEKGLKDAWQSRGNLLETVTVFPSANMNNDFKMELRPFDRDVGPGGDW